MEGCIRSNYLWFSIDFLWNSACAHSACAHLIQTCFFLGKCKKKREKKPV